MRNKKSRNVGKNIAFILVTILGGLSVLSCIMMIIVTSQAKTINETFINSSLKNEQQEVEYITLEKIYENPTEYVDTYQVICCYLCTEFASNTGIAWLSNLKEQSKDDAEYIIRLERDEVIDYTPKAIAVYGKIEYTDEKALIIKNPDFYAYGGTDVSMLKHNALIDEDIVSIVMTALRYEDTTDVTDDLMTLQAIACLYEDEDLELKLTDISKLSVQKQTLSQTEFETKAEQLWNEFRAQLLDR